MEFVAENDGNAHFTSTILAQGCVSVDRAQGGPYTHDQGPIFPSTAQTSDSKQANLNAANFSSKQISFSHILNTLLICSGLRK